MGLIGPDVLGSTLMMQSLHERISWTWGSAVASVISGPGSTCQSTLTEDKANRLQNSGSNPSPRKGDIRFPCGPEPAEGRGSQ